MAATLTSVPLYFMFFWLCFAFSTSTTVHPTSLAMNGCYMGFVNGGDGILCRFSEIYLDHAVRLRAVKRILTSDFHRAGKAFVKTFESIELQLKYTGRLVRLVIVYRPPCGNHTLFFDEFSDYMSLLVTAPGNLLLASDFNFHVNDSGDRSAIHFLSLLQSYNLIQNVSGGTHTAGHTLDLVITRCK